MPLLMVEPREECLGVLAALLAQLPMFHEEGNLGAEVRSSPMASSMEFQSVSRLGHRSAVGVPSSICPPGMPCSTTAVARVVIGASG